MAPYGQDTKAFIAQVKQESQKPAGCGALVAWNDINTSSAPATKELEKQVLK